jgi:hypothetical protein
VIETSAPLEPPFLPETESAADPSFPVRISARAKRRLFSHIVNAETYYGSGLKFFLSEQTGEPHFHYADVEGLDKSKYQFSKFGRVPIAVAMDEAEEFLDTILDCRSFPPGPRTFFVRDRPSTIATFPELTLSLPKLAVLQPDLFVKAGFFTKAATAVLNVTTMFAHSQGNEGWIGRTVGVDDPDGQAEAIEDIAQKLWYFPAEPAMVLSTTPFIVGAYSTFIDGVTLLRMPDASLDAKPSGGAWSVGDRMISCNGYHFTEDRSGDVERGPKADSVCNEMWCIVADLICEDSARLQELKAVIDDGTWERCRSLGTARLDGGAPIRDGRPWYSRVAVRDQKKPVWKAVQPYLK